MEAILLSELSLSVSWKAPLAYKQSERTGSETLIRQGVER